jgi:hypothetical protein
METPKQNKSLRLSRGCVITMAAGAGLVVFGLIIAVAIGLASLPSADEQMPSGFKPVLVNITLPVNGANHLLNEPARVYAEAFGDKPIQSLELTIDSLPFNNKVSSSPAGKERMGTVWAWTPNREGTYTLLVRAVVSKGEGGISRAVRMNVLPADKMPASNLIAGEGQVTPDLTAMASEIAAMADVTPEPPPPGFNDQGEEILPPSPSEEEPNQPPPEEPPQQPGNSIIPVDMSIWLQKVGKKLINFYPPAAPGLNGGADQCTGVLLAKDNADTESGFFLYRLEPNETDFKRIVTIDGKQGKGIFAYHDVGLATGDYIYYLASFTAGGESPSEFVTIHVTDAQCAAALPPQFEPESIPIDPGQPVDKMYCYGSASGLPWVRLPTPQDTFIEPVNGKFDLGPYWKLIPQPIPTPNEVTLNMECWGWSGSTLIYLGSTNQTFYNFAEGAFKYKLELDPNKMAGAAQKFMELPAFLPAPYNVHFASSAQECKTHYIDPNQAYQICDLALRAGYMVLLWDWKPTMDMTLAQAMSTNFIIYVNRPPSLNEDILQVNQNGKRMHDFMPDWQGMEQYYYLRAFYHEGNDKIYSAPSDSVGGEMQKVQVIYKPNIIQMELYMARHMAQTSDNQGPYWTNDSSGKDLKAGHMYRNFSELGQWWWQESLRIAFPGANPYNANGHIVKANLTWEKEKPDYVASAWYPCAEVMDGNPMVVAGNKMTTDVTAQVRMWEYGKEHTIIITNRRKDLSDIAENSEDVCFSYYKSFRLEVFTVP